MRRFSGTIAVLCLVAQPAGLLADEHTEDKSEARSVERQKVLGIGGLFFRSDDPAALAAWYEKHLGIDPVPTTYKQKPWIQQAGPTVFSPFKRTSESMGNPGKEWVLNLRVADLDAMVTQLRGDGIEVKVDPETYPNGRFASLDDMEGNPIQLWEEMDPAAAQDEQGGGER